MSNTKYLIIILIISLSASNKISAQFQDTNSRTINSNLDVAQFAIKSDSNNSFYAVGSPFINEKFEIARFNNINKTYSARYNAHLGEMQIQRKNDTIALYNTENFEITFPSSSKTYKTYDYTNKENELKRGFLVVLKETDSLALLKEELVKFYPAKESTNGYDKAKPAEYRRTKDVYYYRQGEHVSVLPQKRKDFIKLFPEHSKDLEVFIKKNKINFKQEDDLITLFQYLETL